MTIPLVRWSSGDFGGRSGARRRTASRIVILGWRWPIRLLRPSDIRVPRRVILPRLRLSGGAGKLIAPDPSIRGLHGLAGQETAQEDEQAQVPEAPQGEPAQAQEVASGLSNATEAPSTPGLTKQNWHLRRYARSSGYPLISAWRISSALTVKSNDGHPSPEMSVPGGNALSTRPPGYSTPRTSLAACRSS